MDHLIHFLIALILLVLFFVADYFRRKYYNLPPTIFPCLPVIGHLYLLKQPLYRSLFEIAAKHGPILYLRFGTHRILLISSPSLTEECLIKKMTKLQEKRNAYFQALIDELRKVKDEEDENKKKNTMIAVLFRLQKSDPDYYNDKLIKIFLLNLLAAGTDGPVSTMEWAFSLLLNHPDVLEKAQNEIDKVVGKERLVNESDIANLPYLRCVVSETLRLYPPTPLLLPHQSTEDCVVGGYHVPRGTVLLVNQWGIQHDPKVWSDPERFDPERFVGFEASKDRFRLMAFGAGRRACPGELLAMRMIWLTMGLLIQCFDWERTTEELIDLNEGLGLTMPKAQPLVAKCTPRSMTQSLVS
ncbi:putative cytochrome P450 [Helianthus annuus]|nr:putative cytochrome P450 [Helianthus annuus]